MYRGTSGTEVAYLLRRLIHALGLDERPDQLSIVGTSASIEDDEEGRNFLSEFFGRRSERPFSFVKAPPQILPSALDLSSLGSSLASGACTLADVPIGSTLRDAFAAAMSASGSIRPVALNTVAERMFPDMPTGRLVCRSTDSPASRGRQSQPAARLRAHLFARTLQGLWACCDPDCAALDTKYLTDERKVGKVYTTVRFTCECGSRVLELLYCQSCGETMLGGFVAQAGAREFLLSTRTALDELPDRATTARTAANYRVYWPTNRPPVVTKTWKRTGTQTSSDAVAPHLREMRFVSTRLQHGTGALQGAQSHHRLSFPTSGQGSTRRRRPNVPSFPHPLSVLRGRLGVRMARQTREQPEVRSPIRTQGVGFDRANQVLTGALKRHLGSNLVIFSDSRQGAARVSANLELAHYLDLVRALVLQEVSNSASDKTLIDAYLTKSDRSSDATAAWGRLQARDQDAAMAMMMQAGNFPLESGGIRAIERVAGSLAGRPNLSVEAPQRHRAQAACFGCQPRWTGSGHTSAPRRRTTTASPGQFATNGARALCVVGAPHLARPGPPCCRTSRRHWEHRSRGPRSPVETATLSRSASLTLSPTAASHSTSWMSRRHGSSPARSCAFLSESDACPGSGGSPKATGPERFEPTQTRW